MYVQYPLNTLISVGSVLMLVEALLAKLFRLVHISQ